MKSTAKAEALLRDIADKLKLRLKGSASIDTVRELRDSAGWPMLILSDGANEAAGQPVIGLRIKAVDAVSKDVFGNDLVAFAPHAFEVAYELDGTEGEPSRKDLAIALREAVLTGVKVQIKEIADATAVSAASMDATAVALELESLEWPTKGV